jgi:hypothetical protein
LKDSLIIISKEEAVSEPSTDKTPNGNLCKEQEDWMYSFSGVTITVNYFGIQES